MTTPLFRKGHLYAVQGRGFAVVARYSGASKGMYCFNTLKKNQPIMLSKQDVEDYVIDRIGSDKAQFFC